MAAAIGRDSSRAGAARRRLSVVGSVAAVLLAGASCGKDSSNAAEATGTLEYVEITVSPIGAGRVVRVSHDEGETVQAGDTLVVLTQATIRPNVDAQQARVATADARLRQLIAGPRGTDIERASADLRAAQSEADRTARDVERMTPLVSTGNVSRQQLDAAQTAARTAAAKRDAAQQAVNTLKAGSRPEEIDAARSELANAQAATRGAQATQSDLVLLAPVAGTIVSRAAERGEVIGPGMPAMSIADVTRPYVRVFVNQSVLPLLHVGDSVSAVLDAFPDQPFRGRIASLSTRAEYTPRVALTRDERADLVFGVKVEFVDATGRLKAGLPLTVRFDRPKPAK